MVKEVIRNQTSIQPMSTLQSARTNNIDNYEEAVRTLNSLQTNASVIQQAKKRIGQPNSNVEDTRKYLQRSGISQETLDSSVSIIHVAGTKGKGSTCAFTESILRHHGYRTGFYSSPHLIAVRERIRINGEPLSKESFTKYFWDVYHKLIMQRDHEGDMPPYFKFLTVMAFNVFIKEQVDVAIVEVGIGGELDCTNVIKYPAVVGITSLGLDHTSLLGHTVELIANQKAGIMKFGAPAFTVDPQPGGSLDVLRDKASQVGCSLSAVPAFRDYICPGLEKPKLGLDSEVQKLNASLAVQLSHAWLRHHKTGMADGSTTLKLDEITTRGLKSARWPGRAQVFPHGSRICFFLDGAHTTDSIENCLSWFIQASNSHSDDDDDVHRVLIFNSTGEREPANLLQPLWESQVFDSVAFAPNIASSARDQSSDQSNYMVTTEHQLERSKAHSVAWNQLSSLHLPDPFLDSHLTHSPQPSVKCEAPILSSCVVPQVFPSVADAIEWVEGIKTTKPVHVLVTGSLHLVGCALGLLESADIDMQSVSIDQSMKQQKISALPLTAKVH